MKIRVPAIKLLFSKGDDDWEYAYTTMDLLIVFYLIPERMNNLQASISYWKKFKVGEMGDSFRKGKVSINGGQAYLFLDATDAISKLLSAGDAEFLDKIFRMISRHTRRFASALEFKTYYLYHAKQLLTVVRQQIAHDPETLMLYELIFKRWKDNCSYREWCEKNVINLESR